jgi:hypothetical protein
MSAHHWEQWLELESQAILRFLWVAKKWLATAWKWDSEDPSSYPMNTSHALSEIKEGLVQGFRKARSNRPLPKPIQPSSLAELIPEDLVRSIWEDNHSMSFAAAIKVASGFQGDSATMSSRTFAQILRAMEIAFQVSRFGYKAMARPKVNILHQGLCQIASAAGLQGLTRAGLAQFLDDLCPCGLKSHKEALRKLAFRSQLKRRKSRKLLGDSVLI